MNDRPTPETDRAFKFWPCEQMELVDADFARKLERERDEAREDAQRKRVELNHLWQANEMAEEAFRERDEARDFADRYRVAFCSAKGDLVPQAFPWEAAE